MPKFVIERQYLVPMYQHIVIEAENLEEACKNRISDDIVRSRSPAWGGLVGGGLPRLAAVSDQPYCAFVPHRRTAITTRRTTVQRNDDLDLGQIAMF
jgi:hypothetical protein